MLLATLLAALGQASIEGPVYSNPALFGRSYAFFEFAPTDGTGMGAPCACSTPAGAKAEVVTFTRASSGTCLKAATSTGIANGDLITCSTNQARVMPGGDGTGVRGLLVEGARTNVALRSEELENAAWTQLQDVGALTVTADAAVAPDGTTTADRVQIPATGAAHYALLYQSLSLTGAASASALVKGNATSGTTDICLYNNGGSVYGCAPCTYVAGSWTKCKVENVPSGAANGTLLIGNASLYNGGTARGAQDIFVWGVQWEVSVFASSYIKTTSASATRALDLATVALPTSWTAATASWASTVIPATQGATSTTSQNFVDANNYFSTLTSTNLTRAITIIAANVVNQNLTTQPTVGVENRVVGYSDGAALGSCLAGTCTTSAQALTLPTGSMTVALGSRQDGTQPAQGVVKLVCLDPVATRCH